MALDLGLGVYEETEVDADYNEVGLEPLITSTTSVVEDEKPGIVDAGGETEEPSAAWGPEYGQYAPPENFAAPAIQQDDMTETAGKLFLGGISWQTDETHLHDYFSQFGDLVDVAVMRNKATGISRGFGFITFGDPAVVDTVLASDHVLDGRRVDIKRAVPRDRAPPPSEKPGGRGGPYGPPPPGPRQDLGVVQPQEYPPQVPPPQALPGGGQTRKLFVGGLAPSVSEQDFRAYFERFGPVVDAVVMFDRNTLRSRGFGFVTFADLDAARQVIATSHELQGKFVEVKSAEPKEVMNQQQQHHHHVGQQQYGGGPGHHRGPGGGGPHMGGDPRNAGPGYGSQRGGHQQYQQQNYPGPSNYGGQPPPHQMGPGQHPQQHHVYNDQPYMHYPPTSYSDDPYADQRNMNQGYGGQRYDPYGMGSYGYPQQQQQQRQNGQQQQQPQGQQNEGPGQDQPQYARYDARSDQQGGDPYYQQQRQQQYYPPQQDQFYRGQPPPRENRPPQGYRPY